MKKRKLSPRLSRKSRVSAKMTSGTSRPFATPTAPSDLNFPQVNFNVEENPVVAAHTHQHIEENSVNIKSLANSSKSSTRKNERVTL